MDFLDKKMAKFGYSIYDQDENTITYYMMSNDKGTTIYHFIGISYFEGQYFSDSWMREAGDELEKVSVPLHPGIMKVVLMKSRKMKTLRKVHELRKKVCDLFHHDNALVNDRMSYNKKLEGKKNIEFGKKEN